MPSPANDNPYGAPAYAAGPLTNLVYPVLPTPTPAPTAQPSLLDRVISLFHTTPSPAPKMISKADELEQQLSSLEQRSTLLKGKNNASIQ